MPTPLRQNESLVSSLRWIALALGAVAIAVVGAAIFVDGTPDTLIATCTGAGLFLGVPALIAGVIAHRIEYRTTAGLDD